MQKRQKTPSEQFLQNILRRKENAMGNYIDDSRIRNISNRILRLRFTSRINRQLRRRIMPSRRRLHSLPNEHHRSDTGTPHGQA